MQTVNPEIITNLLKKTSDRFIIPRYQLLQEHEISTKTGPNDLVTQADIEAEQYLSERLPELLPGSVVIGEEGVSSGNIILSDIENSANDIWVVDPVDGTFNFVKGRPEFGIMLALIRNGETVMAWIYNILADEMVFAEKGAGTQINGERVEIESGGLHTAPTGFVNPRYFPTEQRSHIKVISDRHDGCVSIGCAAHEYLNLLKGRVDFALYTRIKPWDHLPGTLIVSEAGGYVAKWDGSAYEAKERGIGLIAARTQEAWQNTYDLFLEDIPEV
jgi:fructose-1,6-bisphosphatase/inositol monophosphatase family enzyme